MNIPRIHATASDSLQVQQLLGYVKYTLDEQEWKGKLGGAYDEPPKDHTRKSFATVYGEGDVSIEYHKANSDDDLVLAAHDLGISLDGVRAS